MNEVKLNVEFFAARQNHYGILIPYYTKEKVFFTII